MIRYRIKKTSSIVKDVYEPQIKDGFWGSWKPMYEGSWFLDFTIAKFNTEFDAICFIQKYKDEKERKESEKTIYINVEK